VKSNAFFTAKAACFFLISAYTGGRVSRDCGYRTFEMEAPMMENILVDNAKVMAKGQITLPKDVREALGIRTGDRVTLIRKGDQVVMMNSAVYAMKTLQAAMEGEAEKAGLRSDDDVADMLMEMRKEDEM